LLPGVGYAGGASGLRLRSQLLEFTGIRARGGSPGCPKEEKTGAKLIAGGMKMVSEKKAHEPASKLGEENTFIKGQQSRTSLLK